MGTPFKEIYEVFLSKIEQDVWDLTIELNRINFLSFLKMKCFLELV